MFLVANDQLNRLVAFQTFPDVISERSMRRFSRIRNSSDKTASIVSKELGPQALSWRISNLGYSSANPYAKTTEFVVVCDRMDYTDLIGNLGVLYLCAASSMTLPRDLAIADDPTQELPVLSSVLPASFAA